jgi:hypothetical protein
MVLTVRGRRKQPGPLAGARKNGNDHLRGKWTIPLLR